VALDHLTAESLADVTEVLMGEYREYLSLAAVSDVVLAAHRDLHGQVPDDAHPELLYRLARQRLSA